MATLIELLNKLLAKANYSDPAIDQLVKLVNNYISQGSSQQATLTSLEPKIDKLIELIGTFQNNPQDFGKTISEISKSSISYTRVSGPLSLQIVGAYRIKYNGGSSTDTQGIRFIFRLGLEGEVQPEHVAVPNGPGNRAEKWQALGDKGTACYFNADSTGIALPRIYSFGLGTGLSVEKKLAPNEIPMTLVVNAFCPDFVEKDPVDVRIRLYYKMPSGPTRSTVSPTNDWQIADFKFGAVTPSFYPSKN